jgi:uncharacterized membrane protein YkoI
MRPERATGMVMVATVRAFGLPGAGRAVTAQTKQAPAYKSSVPVTTQNGRSGEDREERGESSEAARLAPLAKVDVGQATAAALAQVPGTALRTSLDDENGNVVSSVEVKTSAGEIKEVKVDAGTGAVLHVDVAGSGEDEG